MASRKVYTRESARRDLMAEWLWFAENTSVNTADRFLIAVEATAQHLVEDGPSNRSVQVPTGHTELRDLRRFAVLDGFERMFLFYLPTEDGIDLIRVLHGSRALERLLTNGHTATAASAR